MADNLTSVLLDKGKHWSLLSRAEEKSKELLSFSVCITFQK